MSLDNSARLSISSGDPLDVRSFEITQAMSSLFRVVVVAVSPNLDIDFDEVLGEEAGFTLFAGSSARSFSGVVAEISQRRVDDRGLGTYEVVLVPRAWLLTQRTNYRIFQYASELEIVQRLLSEWGVSHRVECGGVHKNRKFRMQYGETDYAFMSRMLEDAGISTWFDDAEGESVLVLSDDPQSAQVAHSLRFHDNPGITDHHFATKVHVGERLRPGRTTIADLDHRRPSTSQPSASAALGLATEAALEQFDYEPGAFLYVASAGGSTPAADDRGTSRTDESAGATKTNNRLLGRRQDHHEVSFTSDAIALAPGATLVIADHPHVAASGALLLTRATLRGAHNDDFRVDIVAVPAGEPFRPAPVTPKPLVYGLESATVVGPGTDDIHTDEYGRVRVHFHWDRESGRNEASSCWIPTNQPWAGAGFGGTVIPRVGQEVLVEFLGGDPDRPVVIGRTYTEHQPPPYELPRGKKLTALIGNPTPGMLMGGAMGGVDSQIFELQRGNSPAFTSLTENSIRSSGNTGIADRQREQARNSNLKPNDEFAADLPQDMRTQAGYGDTRNMFVVGDEKDKNLVFMQAQRDLNILAKNNWRTVVGNFRGIAILGNDDLHVRNKQLVSVVDAQLLQVEKDQSIDVTKKRTEDIGTTCGLIVTKHAKIEVKTTMTLKAKKSIVFESDEAIQFRVGSSVVRIDKNAIGLSSKRIDLNPAAVTAKARFEPITDARKAAFEAAARKAMAAKPASQEDRLSQYESSQTNPDLQQAGTDGLNHQMQNGENASTISGNNYAAYRDQLQRGMHTGGRTMSPEMADSTLNQFMAQ